MRPTIFLNDSFILADKKMLRSISPGIIAGRGAFETMGVEGGKIIALERHLKRLNRALKHFHIRNPLSPQSCRQHIREVIRRNNLRKGSIRILFARHKSSLSISIVPRRADPQLERKYKAGFKMYLSSIQRNPSRNSHVKSIDYEIFLKAYKQSREKGCDEAILLNRKGEVVEGSRTNVFIVRDNCLTTPSIASGCLDGITRKIVLELAKKLRISARAKILTLEDLKTADEVFLTNAAMGLMPVTRLKGKSRQAWKIGPVTRKLFREYRKRISTF